jgi:hypothetical protein
VNTIISINVVFIVGIHYSLSSVRCLHSLVIIGRCSLVLTKIDSLIRSKDSMLLEFMKILKIFSRKNCLELDNQPNNQPNY